MPTIKETLKLALDALQKSFPPDGSKYEVELEQKHREAIAAIQELLDRSVADPEPIGYMQKVIEALYENGDPVSIDAAELLERVSTVTTQWQPIDTAPKDGTYVLICRAIDADGAPINQDAFGLFVHRANYWKDGEWWIVENGNVFDQRPFFEPTHWMPLPKPPINSAIKDKPCQQ